MFVNEDGAVSNASKPVSGDEQAVRMMEAQGAIPSAGQAHGAAVGAVLQGGAHALHQAQMETDKAAGAAPVPGIQAGPSSASASVGYAQPQEHPSTNLLIGGLIDQLPPIGSTWSTADRQKWLNFAASAFEVLYKMPRVRSKSPGIRRTTRVSEQPEAAR